MGFMYEYMSSMYFFPVTLRLGVSSEPVLCSKEGLLSHTWLKLQICYSSLLQAGVSKTCYNRRLNAFFLKLTKCVNIRQV